MNELQSCDENTLNIPAKKILVKNYTRVCTDKALIAACKVDSETYKTRETRKARAELINQATRNDG